MRKITDDQLTLDDVPDDVAKWREIAAFALSSDGYLAIGGFDELAELANARTHRTLSEARACLFFEQRRWRHFGEEPDANAMEYVRSLLGAIRGYVRERASPVNS